MSDSSSASSAWHLRLQAEMDRLGWNKTRLSNESGVNYDSVNKYLRGDVDQPRGNAIEKLAKALGVEPVYLREGLKPGPEVSETAIPVRGKVAAGVWMEVGQIDDPSDWLPFNPLPAFPKGSVFALVVDGDSMDKIAAHGSTIICSDLAMTAISLRDEDIAIVERRRQQEGLREVTAKRVRLQDGELWLIPESNNPRWQTAKYRLNECHDDTEIRVIARLEYILRRP